MIRSSLAVDRRRLGLFSMLLLQLAFVGGAANAAAPVLQSAVSRMTHGTAGAYDVQLPLTGASGIECRANGVGLSIVLSFDQAVVSGAASITAGTATVSGSPVFATNTMTVNLTSVADAQAVTLTVTNVKNGSGTALASAAVPFRVLQSDVNGSGTVTGSDVNLLRAQVGIGATVNGGNFRCDVNGNGLLSGSDVNVTMARAGVGATVAGGATANTAPTIGALSDQSAFAGQTAPAIAVTVGDAESAPSTLYVSATSSDLTLIPNPIVVGGTDVNRTLTITPAANVTGTAVITVSVSDGLLTTSTTFNLNIVLPPAVAVVAAEAGVTSSPPGSGSATIQLSTDQLSATVRASYSNLTTPETGAHIRGIGAVGSGSPVLLDLDNPALPSAKQSDGSILWVFPTSGSPSAAQIVQAIKAGQVYFEVRSQQFTTGEVAGQFQWNAGPPAAIVPPTPSPAITINPPSAADASRFLQQAGFGGTGVEIAALSNASAANAGTALNDWLTQQFNTPLPISPDYSATASPQANTYSASSMYKMIYDRVTTAQAPNAYGDPLQDDWVHEAWWRNVCNGGSTTAANTTVDQLRQRVATALSEIMVVSEINDNTDNNIMGLASYYDMLADDAFVNFRQIMGDVTLHPIMGDYLNMKGNRYVANTSPNENYAREILQLFSTGLYLLNEDGSLALDQNGQPIATYDQSTITQFAQVFTGWDQNGTPVVIPTLISDGATPTPGGVVSSLNSYYQKPMVLTQSNHSPLAKTLLKYTGAAVWSGQSTAGVIPASSGQTGTVELNFALDNIFNHPNVPPFICKQLIQRLIGSNPSPGFVYRVVQVFKNNGSGVRGDMKAVLTAILTDYEARTTAQNASVKSNQAFGHGREPLIRLASLLRSMNATSKSGKWHIGKTDTTFNQTIFRSPTVFNFFDPRYADSAPQAAGVVSPEFDIIYATTITNIQNMIYTGIYATYNADGSPALTGTGFRGDAFGSDIYLNFAATGSNLMPIAAGGASQLGTTGTTGLIDQVGLLLMGTAMDPTMKTTIFNFLSNTSNFTTTDNIGRVKAAVYLVSTSAQAAAQK